MRYAAPWDRTLRISTAFLLVAAAVSIAAVVRFAPSGRLAGALVASLVAVTFLLAWALAPRGFSVEGNHVRIERPLRPVSVPLAEIRGAGLLPDGALLGAMRLGGSGGLFGWYGRFWSRRLGSFRAYATRTRGLVRLDTARGLFVLSPEPPARFVDEVLGRAPGAVSVDPAASQERHPVPRRTWILLGAGIALVPLVLAAVFAGTWAFSPRAASVDAGAIRIERELAGPVVIPLSDVLDVDLVPACRAGRFHRVAGYAGIRVAFGHFRTETLGDFQLYAWRPGPYVVLDVPGERIVLTPDSPDAFVAAVRGGIGAR